MTHDQPWTVLLLGGASGVGKTSVSYRLARHYGVNITEVDDFQVILEAMTTPEQYPTIHYWRTHHEEALRMDDAQQLAHMLRYSQVMGRALDFVIANHLEANTPIILEGDFILPELAVRTSFVNQDTDGRVRGLFIYEQDEAQIFANYQAREGSDQPNRARASWHHSEWLRQEAQNLSIPAIPARPWESVFERAVAAIDT